MLNLTEKLFLFSIDDARGTSTSNIIGQMYSGLYGALLADLAIRGKLAIVDDRLIVADHTPTGDPLLDEALEVIASTKKLHRPGYWITNLPVKKLSRRVADGLVEKKILVKEKKRYLSVVPYEAYAQQDASAKYWVKQHLRSMVLAGEKTEAEDVALLSLLKACSLLKLVFTRDERKAAQKRIDELVAGEVFGPVVAEVLAEIDAAMMAAISAGIVNS